MKTSHGRLGFAVVTCVLFVGACGTRRTVAPTATTAPASTTVETGVLPTPFTAEQIRDTNVPGTRLTFRLQTFGRPDMLQTFHWIGGDETTSIMEAIVEAADGSVPVSKEVGETPWTELRDHAAFPAADTTRSDEACTVGAGSFDCMKYVVTDHRTDPPTVNHFYFARSRPGPPVLFISEQGGETVYRMELIEDSRG